VSLQTPAAFRRVGSEQRQRGGLPRHRARIGILDHTDSSLGGGQLVVGQMASSLSHRHDVQLLHRGRGYSLGALRSAFGLDLVDVTERTVPTCPTSFQIPGSGQVRRDIAMGRALTEPYDLFVYAGHGVPPFCYAPVGIVYCHFPMESRPDMYLRGDERWRRRNRIDRWTRSLAYGVLWRLRMRRYRMILTNSRFTAEWIQRRWGRAADVLYPPVDLEIPETEKQNLIVSIGRFDGGSRTKNQLGQVDTFRALLGSVAGWRLSIIGASEDRAYEQRVRAAAGDLPVTLLADVDRDTIWRSLAEAKLFWHTTGIPAEEERCPEAAEHFGIATVEAMRAGCVPVVIASGGQREIVEDDVSGFLCQDLGDVLHKTITIARDERRRGLMSIEAQRRSRLFTREAFDRRFMPIVSQCLRRDQRWSLARPRMSTSLSE
jgi:glycosyltransferase involved in cell wall biosynthesis